MENSRTFGAGATPTIATSVFVSVDPTQNDAVVQASGGYTIGISQNYAKYAPIPNASAVAADTAGDPVQVYLTGSQCLLQSTSAGWTAGDLLKPNASGQGVTASGSDVFGAVATSTLTGAGLGVVVVTQGVVS